MMTTEFRAKRIDVLLIEDNTGDVRLIQETLRDANAAVRLFVATDGVDAMAFLKHETGYKGVPIPDIILLDLQMPKMNGLEVLAKIKRDEELKIIPTVILTACDGAVSIDVGIGFDAISGDEVTASCGEVNALIARPFGEAFPAIDLAHRYLS